VTVDAPEDDELRAYLLGNVSESEQQRIAAFLDTHPEYLARLAKLDAERDSLVDDLRAPADAYREEPQFRQGLTRIRNLRALRQSQGQTPEALEAIPRVGNYEPKEWISRRGLGLVYRATESTTGRSVVIKCLPAARGEDPDLSARFRREMDLVGTLEHPNIVRFLESGEAGGNLFIVLEHLVGFDLARLMDAVGPLPIADACAIVLQAARGLERAHESHLIHRDVKPSNLFLTQEGVVKVLDLGLARSVNVNDETLTESGQFLGTIDYMAPEQAFDTHTADVRSDIYSLGCTLYKLLVGVAPFSGPEYRHLLKKALAHSSMPMVPVRERRAETPSGVAEILERMCAKAPADRPQSCTDVGESLQPFAAGADLPALVNRASLLVDDPVAIATLEPQGIGMPKRLSDESQPRGARSAVWVAAALAGVVVVGLLLRQELRREPPQVAAVTPVVQTPQTVVAAPVAEEATPPAPPSPPPEKSSHLVTAGLAPSEVSRIFQGAVNNNFIWCFELSPDGMRIRTGSNDGELRCWDIATGIKLFGQRHNAVDHATHAIAVTRSETYCIAVGYPPYVTMWDLSNGAKVREFVGHVDRVTSISLSPDETRIASCGWDGTVRVCEVADGTLLRTLTPDIGKLLAVRYSPNGNVIAVAGRSAVVLYDAETGESLRSLVGPTAYMSALAFTADSASVVVGGRDNAARMWRVADGVQVRVFKGHTNWVNAVAISPDDKLLLTGSSDRTVRLWHLDTAELAREYVGHSRVVNAVGFRPGKNQVVSAGEDDEIRFWSIPE